MPACPKCHETKSPDDFYWYKTEKLVLKPRSPCKKCQREGSKRWRENNHDVAIWNTRDWRANKKRLPRIMLTVEKVKRMALV